MQNPDLILIDRASSDAGSVVPLRREFPLASDIRLVFLDILGVTRAGRLVLVECKLWRNPQARREVVAQVLEYASLLRGLTYSDLTAQLRPAFGSGTQNPIYEPAKARWPDLEEASFVDSVTRSLAYGDFHLVIAGDGIRSDLHAIADHLNVSNLSAARLVLLEIQVWSDGNDTTLVVPNLSLRTEVIQQRVFLGTSGELLKFEGDTAAAEIVIETTVNPDAASQRAINRSFRQRFIETIRFDHPDQSPPRHGGNNWVKLDPPSPVSSVTVYRTASENGIFARFGTPDGVAFLDWLAAKANVLRKQSGLALEFRTSGDNPMLSAQTPTKGDDDLQLRWLLDVANRFVTVIRTEANLWHGQSD